MKLKYTIMRKSLIVVSAACGLLLLPCTFRIAAGGVGAPVPVSPTKERGKDHRKSEAELTDIIGYDVIGKARFLRTMARDFYGNPEFWPYIYMENSEFGDPDRIKPGTPVRVPRLSKYGVDPNSAADLEKAMALGKEIYARYGK